MAVIDNARTYAAAPVANAPAPFPGQAGPVKPLKPAAKLWLNPGMPKADGSVIFLPQGVPLDTMDFLVPKGQNQDWINRADESNAFLETLQTWGAANVGPGQERHVPGIQFYIRHVSDRMSPTHDRRTLVAHLTGMLNALQADESQSQE